MSKSESKRSVVYREEADFDFADAVEYYESQQPGLGARLKIAVLECVERAAANPENSDIVFNNHRARYVSKFPYRVIYRVEDERIVIIAVAHHSQERDYWHDRVDNN